MIPFIEPFLKKKILEMESRLEACTVVEHEKMEVSVVFKGQCKEF